MTKNIGKSGSNPGEFNISRLAVELARVGVVVPVSVEDNGDIVLEFEDTKESVVNGVISAHKPIPLPTELSESDRLKVALVEMAEEVEHNKVEFQLTIAEVVEAQSQTASTSY